MKVGDKKQAIGLGVVAVFAVGMLGKTALGTVGKTSVNQPLVVQDLGGTSKSSTDPTPSAESPAPPTVAGSTNEHIQASNSTAIKREAFQKWDIPEKTKSFEPSVQASSTNPETSTPTNGYHPRDPRSSEYEIGGGPIPGADPEKQEKINSNEKKETPKKEESPVARYEGYVDSGSPMGIVSVNGSSFSVSVGDSVGLGYTVESISSQKIRIRKGKISKTISIGKETKI
jgi:hypothetical protein